MYIDWLFKSEEININLAFDMYQMTHFWFEYASFQILQGAFIKLTLALSSSCLMRQVYFKYWKLNFFHTFNFLNFCALIKMNTSSIKIIVTLASSQIFEGQWKIWKKLHAILTFRFHESCQKIGVFCSIGISKISSHRKLSWNFTWNYITHLKTFM